MTVHDVLILGAGPAGATVASLLAAEGVDAALVERETFPRFHIGESLLPCDLALFRRLGVDTSQPGFLFKGGADFIKESTGETAQYLFRDGLLGTPDHAYQVERSLFDALLLDLAQRSGARSHCPVQARSLNVRDDGVELDTDAGTLRARYFVDASGQAAWLGRKQRSVQRIDGLGRLAAFRHYTNLSDAAVEALVETGLGNIRVLILDGGWAWVIPLPGRRLSLGLVTRDAQLDAADVDRLVSESPMLSELLAGAEAGPTRTVSDFSYANTRSSGSRYVCVGDAALFLDPVFSSGVSLAMLGAEQVADRLLGALREDTLAEPDLMTPVGAHMQVAYRAFGSLVRAFYHTKIVDHVFFAPAPVEALRRGLISTLAGDVWRDDNPFEHMLYRSKRRLFEPWHETQA